MLSSITPLGERGRRQRWGVTATAFALGSGAAGAATGGGLGTLGAALGLSTSDPAARLGALAIVLGLAAGLDLARRVPGPRRQVDERWLDAFRGWVYGLGFGAQLGVGVATVITSAATLCALSAALLTGSAAAGAAIGGLYGLIRGAGPALTVGVRSPGALFALHRGLDRWREPVRRGVAGGLALLALVAAAGAVG